MRIKYLYMDICVPAVTNMYSAAAKSLILGSTPTKGITFNPNQRYNKLKLSYFDAKCSPLYENHCCSCEICVYHRENTWFPW